MKLYGGIDLHSNNSYLAVLNERLERVYQRRLPNDLGVIGGELEPYREELVGIVVESTYNWYWLVDGLQGLGYRLHLAHVPGNRQYSGLKYSDDPHEARWLARLLALGVLAEGYIYPKGQREVRDMARRRLLLVRAHTAQLLSVQGAVVRHTAQRPSARELSRLTAPELAERYGAETWLVAVGAQLRVMRCLAEEIAELERELLSRVRLLPEFRYLKTVPGIGPILGLVIMLEVGEIGRFAKVGQYASYARCVRSEYRSNDKRKGSGNVKNGNKYLSWAYVEAAHFAQRFCAPARRYYQRKAARTQAVVARKALAHKLARASFYVMRDQVAFDVRRVF